MAAIAGEGVDVGADFSAKGQQAQLSYVWKYLAEDDSNSTVKCRFCAAVLKHHKNNTSTMLDHLKMKHPLPTVSTSSNC